MRLVPLALAVLVLPSCITADLSLAPPPNTPASIESTSTADNPLYRIIDYRPTAVTDGGVVDFQPFELEVVIRDPDVTQDLQYLIYVDGRSGGGDDGGDIPANGTAERTFSYTTSELVTTLSTEGCHRIEMRVSEDFQTGSPRPIVDGDLGTAVWWVATTPEGRPSPSMNGCPR